MSLNPIRDAEKLALQRELVRVLEELDPTLGNRVSRLLERRISEGCCAERSKRVLIVDDSQACRMLAIQVLSEAGYEVRSVSDGVEAWSLLQDVAFDVVVSDLQMPQMGGLGLLEKVRSSGPLCELPVILNTAVEDAESRAEALAAGANDYIPKASLESRDRLLQSVARWSRGEES